MVTQRCGDKYHEYQGTASRLLPVAARPAIPVVASMPPVHTAAVNGDPSKEQRPAHSPDESRDLEERLDDLNRNLREAAHPGIGAGMTFAIVALLGAGAGYWLDGRFGSSPWLVIAGTIFGAVFGFIHLVETIAPGTLFQARKPR